MQNGILILDFGSQYTHLIKLRLSELGIHATIEPADISVIAFNKQYPSYTVKGIILSGGAYSLSNKKIPFDETWLTSGIPLLGICYGHQLIAQFFGGSVKRTTGEYGKERVTCNDQVGLFSGIEERSVVWMSHSDTVTELPSGFISIASTDDFQNAGIANEKRSIYGLQFHPEVTHTSQGLKILANFGFRICRMSRFKSWSPAAFVQETIKNYRQVVAGENVIVALSGGVDSSTLIVLLRKFIPKGHLFAVYIDTGLDQSKSINDVKELCDLFDINLLTKDASSEFFRALQSISEPSHKRIIVGHVFIREFEKIAEKVHADIFAQGTIWSDVIESGKTKFSSKIKPHHNVGGLPTEMNFQLIEPLRSLFKTQVRELAAYLGLPQALVKKGVFPGPGFALRVDGEVTRENISAVRKSTEIIEDVLLEHNLKKSSVMGFAVYINVRSSGIKGDMQVTNNHAIVVRIVNTEDLLTASFSQEVFPFLEEISNRIIKGTGVGKVLYDITNKPPSTIDWQ